MRMRCKNSILSKRDIIVLLCCAALSFLTLMVFSFSTSFLYDNNSCYDPNIFEIIGKNWRNGFLPYVDTWDSKGPIIFFFNMIGYFIGGRSGVFAVQVINLSCCLYCFYRFLRSDGSFKTASAGVFLFLFSYITICSGGNQVCDYTLLLSVASTFLIYRWVSAVGPSSHTVHPLSYSFIYGLFFAGSLLSRLSNAVGLCVSIIVIVVMLSIYGKWKNIIMNVGSFFVGFLVLFVPFALYFHLHNAIGEMWYAMFTYNVEYALSSDSSETVRSFSSFIYTVVYFFSVISLFLTSLLILIFNKERKVVGLFYLIISSAVLFWLYSSYANANYAIVYLPLIGVTVSEMKKLLSKASCIKYFAISFILVFFLGFLNHVRVFRSYIIENDTQYDEILHGLEPDYKSSFVAYNCMTSIYLYSGIKPACRFFFGQDWTAHNGKSAIPLIRKNFNECHATWILVNDYRHCLIKDILQKNYQAFRTDKSKDLILFKRKQQLILGENSRRN